MKLLSTSETKSVTSSIYLDMNEGLPDVSEYEKELSKAENDYRKGLISDTIFESTCEELHPKIEEGHNYRFVGKVGRFCPVKPGCGGGELIRDGKDRQGNPRYFAVGGSKGYRWLESEMVKELGKEENIDTSYYENLATEAAQAILAYGDYEWFVSDDPYIGPEFVDGMPVYEEELPFN